MGDDPTASMRIWENLCTKELLQWRRPEPWEDVESSHVAEGYAVPAMGEAVIMAGTRRHSGLNGTRCTVESNGPDRLGFVTVRVCDGSSQKRLKVQTRCLMPGIGGAAMGRCRPLSGGVTSASTMCRTVISPQQACDEQHSRRARPQSASASSSVLSYQQRARPTSCSGVRSMVSTAAPSMASSASSYARMSNCSGGHSTASRRSSSCGGVERPIMPKLRSRTGSCASSFVDEVTIARSAVSSHARSRVADGDDLQACLSVARAPSTVSLGGMFKNNDWKPINLSQLPTKVIV